MDPSQPRGLLGRISRVLCGYLLRRLARTSPHHRCCRAYSVRFPFDLRTLGQVPLLERITRPASAPCNDRLACASGSATGDYGNGGMMVTRGEIEDGGPLVWAGLLAGALS